MREQLAIRDITVDMEINTVPELDMNLVNEYKADMINYGVGLWQEEWDQPIKVTNDGTLYSGFHTVEAAKQAFGLEHVLNVEKRGKDRDDALLLATGENAHRGRRRSNDEKRQAAFRWLTHPAGKQYTNSHIAKQTNTSTTLVTAVEKEITSNKESDFYDPDYERPTALRYKTRWGEESVMETKNIGVKLVDVQNDENLVDPDEQVMEAYEKFRTRLPDRMALDDFFKKRIHIQDIVICFSMDKGISYQPEEGKLWTASLPEGYREELIMKLEVDYYTEFAEKLWKEIATRLGSDKEFPRNSFIQDYDEDDIKRELRDHYRYYWEWKEEELDFKGMAEEAGVSEKRIRELMKKTENNFHDVFDELAQSIDNLNVRLSQDDIVVDEETALRLASTTTTVRPPSPRIIAMYKNPKEEIQSYNLIPSKIHDWTKTFTNILAMIDATKDREEWVDSLFEIQPVTWVQATLQIGIGNKEDNNIHKSFQTYPVNIISKIDLDKKDIDEKLWEQITNRLQEVIKDKLTYGNDFLVETDI